jgi:thiamine biosynthesis lipoprotein
MGSTFEIALFAPDGAAAQRAFDRAFARIEALNAIFTDYDSASEASRLSLASPMASPAPVSAEMWTLLERALEVSRRSQGAFDVTVGPLTKLWRRARRQHQLPPSVALEQARAAVGYQHVRLDPATRGVQLDVPRMRLDFGGIAKGFAADEALAVLKAAGLRRALVNASGNVALGDPPPGERGWKIGVAPLNPREPPTHFLRLANCGIATSGDALQFVEIDGRRYSHILDPHTGLGLSDHVSATVVAPDGTLADAWATALCVLGPAEGLRVMAKLDRTACLLVRLEQGQIKTYRSDGFPEFAD